jgi:hypothetical protein
MILELFYNLKNRIIEYFVEGGDIRDVIKALTNLENTLTIKDKDQSMEQINEMITRVLNKLQPLESEPRNSYGPTISMQNHVATERLIKSRRADWVIAYGKLCKAREELVLLEAEEQQLLTLLDNKN